MPAQECKRTLIWTPGDYGNNLLAPVLQDASLFGVQGCAASGLVPRCCNGPEVRSRPLRLHLLCACAYAHTCATARSVAPVLLLQLSGKLEA